MEDVGFPGRVGGRARPKDDKYQGNIKRQISKENWTKYQNTNIKEISKDKYQENIKRQISKKYQKTNIKEISKENWTKYQKTNIKETPKDKYQGDIKRQIPRKYEKKTGQSRIPIRNTNEKGW